MEYHAFEFQLKTIQDSGAFTGLASAYSVVDRGNDRVMPGAFTKTLAKSRRRPLLLQHDPGKPVGWADLVDTPEGLAVDGKLDLEDPLNIGRFAHHKMRSGELSGLSIGYLVPPSGSTFKAGVRELSEIDLFEVSVVGFPMNEAARVHAVKATGHGDLIELPAGARIYIVTGDAVERLQRDSEPQMAADAIRRAIKEAILQ